jgi:hypothetical protein
LCPPSGSTERKFTWTLCTNKAPNLRTENSDLRTAFLLSSSWCPGSEIYLLTPTVNVADAIPATQLMRFADSPKGAKIEVLGRRRQRIATQYFAYR